MVVPRHPAIARLHRAYDRGIAPVERLSIADWANRYMRLSSKASAEPGEYRVERTPHMREILECLSEDHPAQFVVAMLASQMAKSQAMLNVIGYVIHYSPGPVLLVQPDVERAETFSKQRIAPMLADVPELRALVADPKSRDSGNTLRIKEFPGGILIIVGSNSPSGLASMPIRWLLFDEVDRFMASAGTEGSPIELAIKRTTTFGARRKVGLFSSPSTDDPGTITEWYVRSDQRIRLVQCPHCSAEQELVWEGLDWVPGQKDTARYVCQVNGCLIDEHCKDTMLPDRSEACPTGARWQPTAESAIPGFRASALYLPLGQDSWATLVEEYERAQSSGDLQQLKTFWNTRLCRTFDETADYAPPDGWDDSRCEVFPCEVPAGVAVLTAGVDVQHDRLEIGVWGWGPGEEAWSVAHLVLPGDPSQPEVWANLDAVRRRRWLHETHAPMVIAMTCIDSSDGNQSEAVWTYCQPLYNQNVRAVKGSSNFRAPIWPRKPSLVGQGRFRHWEVGVHNCKDRLIPRLRAKLPDGVTSAPGYIHVPHGRDEEWFLQMRAEEKVSALLKGRWVGVWRAKRKRNEALDCAVYAYAGLHGLVAAGYTLQELFDARPPRTDDAGRAVARPALAPPPSRGSYMSKFRNGGRG